MDLVRELLVEINLAQPHQVPKLVERALKEFDAVETKAKTEKPNTPA